MKYYELTIYIYHKHSALCSALFESKSTLDAFIDSLSSDLDIIRLGNVVFRRLDFHYAEIKEKTIRGK